MEDIYPLGQGGGLLTDILNFGLNNIYQYGQKTGDFNKRMGAAVNEAQAGGNPNLSPLVSDVISTSPLYTGVINWAGMTDPAKQMLQSFGQRYPKMIGAAEKAPTVMEASINKLDPGVAGALSKPIPSAHFMEVAPEYASNIPTIGHEIQHSLNAPRVAATNPLDALTIGTLLHDILPAGNRGSLSTVLRQQIERPSFLQRLTGNVPKDLKVTNPNRNLMRNAMDEGLAYLGQNAAEGKGGDLIKTLADRLGVNWENPRIPKGFGDVGPELKMMNYFNRFTPQTEVKDAGSKVLDKLWKGINTGREDILPKDQFIRDTVDWLGNSMQRSAKLDTQPLPRGIGAFRKGILGKGDIPKLPIDDTVDLLQHFDKNGLLTPEVLAPNTGRLDTYGTQQIRELDPARMRRLREFLDSTRR